MYYLPVLLLILGGILSSRSYPSLAIKNERNTDGALNVIHDCLDLNEKDKTAEIWRAPIPGNLRSLTIQNCENVVLNISTGEGTKQSFQYFTVRNVKNCEVTGSGKGTSLPKHTSFTNIERMTVSVPLYGETQFSQGVLQFTNVTITALKPKSIMISSSMQKFSITGCTVVLAEKEAVIFHGSFGSLLEIKDSFFYSVDGNFITCNVTSGVIERNRFVHAKEGSFLLNTKNFNSKGNVAFEMEDCAFKVVAEDILIRNSICNSREKYSLKGKICVGLTTGNKQDLTVKSSKSYFDESSNKINSSIYIDNYKRSTNETRKEEMSNFVTRLNNRFFLLWFFAVSALILMFPIAYILKNFLCRIINYVLPLDMKHKPLVNSEET